MAVATWKYEVISSTHLLYWRSLDSDEGIGSSITVLDTAFFKEPGVTPRSQLSLDVRPVENWGKVRTENDLLVSVALEPAPSRPMQNPTPMEEVKK
jgi:hypothetical protein